MTDATHVIVPGTTEPEAENGRPAALADMTAHNGTAPPVADLAERMTARLAELTTARQAFMDQAQRQLAAFDAAIAELTALLAPPAATPAAPDATHDQDR